jgi:hypothetical protein
MCTSYKQSAGQDLPPELSAAIRRRIVIAQPLYALGATLCLISTSWSIAFIVAVQSNYATVPRFRARPNGGV